MPKKTKQPTTKALAKKLARAVFSVGSTPAFPINRLQFMTGKWGVDEKPRGGLCERALQDVLHDALRKELGE